MGDGFLGHSLSEDSRDFEAHAGDLVEDLLLKSGARNDRLAHHHLDLSRQLLDGFRGSLELARQRCHSGGLKMVGLKGWNG